MLCQRWGGRPSLLAAPTERSASKAGRAVSVASRCSLSQPCGTPVHPACCTPASISPESAAACGDRSQAGGVTLGGCSDFRWDAWDALTSGGMFQLQPKPEPRLLLLSHQLCQLAVANPYLVICFYWAAAKKNSILNALYSASWLYY